MLLSSLFLSLSISELNLWYASVFLLCLKTFVVISFIFFCFSSSSSSYFLKFISISLNSLSIFFNSSSAFFILSFAILSLLCIIEPEYVLRSSSRVLYSLASFCSLSSFFSAFSLSLSIIWASFSFVSTLASSFSALVFLSSNSAIPETSSIISFLSRGVISMRFVISPCIMMLWPSAYIPALASTSTIFLLFTVLPLSLYTLTPFLFIFLVIFMRGSSPGIAPSSLLR